MWTTTFLGKKHYKDPFIIEGPETATVLKEDFHDGGVLCAWIDMPGVSKEGVKLLMERDSSFLRAGGLETMENFNECFKMRGDHQYLRKYSASIFLPPGKYKLDQIKASMKNGVLKIVVPKLKLEEQEGVVTVKVVDKVEEQEGTVVPAKADKLEQQEGVVPAEVNKVEEQEECVDPLKDECGSARYDSDWVLVD